MSYCRFSSDNWRCDVYVYEASFDTWVTHVAGHRHIIRPIPQVPFRLMPTFGAEWHSDTGAVSYPTVTKAIVAKVFYWAVTMIGRLHYLSLSLIPRRKIGLPSDGEMFEDGSPGECAARLVALWLEGYRVPDDVIKTLQEEQAERDAAGACLQKTLALSARP